jgi:anti-anti-sigma factor
MSPEGTQFEVTTEPPAEAEGPLVLAVSGELDLAVAQEFSAALDEPERGPAGVVIDMESVTFIDSSALHALLRAVQQRQDLGLPIVLVASEDTAVSRLLELAGVRDRIPVCTSLDEAKAEIG